MISRIPYIIFAKLAFFFDRNKFFLFFFVRFAYINKNSYLCKNKSKTRMQNVKDIINNPKLHEIIRFGIVGGLAAILQIVIYYLLSNSSSHNLSLFVSYIVSLIVNFFLTVYYTFQVKPTTKKGTGFLISHVINFTLQFLFLNFFVYIGMNKQIAIIPVLSICVPINFLLVRYAVKKL